MSARRCPPGSTLAERIALLSISDPVSGCRVWDGVRDRRGYGQLNIVRDDGTKKKASAHRVAYELSNGPIPEGMTVDHTCFNPACVNPQHLRLLTLSENSSLQRKTVSPDCQRGHAWTPENTGISSSGARYCRTCARDGQRRRDAQRRRAA